MSTTSEKGKRKREDNELILDALVEKYIDEEDAAAANASQTDAKSQKSNPQQPRQQAPLPPPRHARTEDEIKDIKQILATRTRQLFVSKTTSEITQLMALHLSTDFNLAQAIARHWMRSSYSATKTLQQEFTQQIWALLTSEIDLAVRCVTTPRQMQGNWHLFGLEQRDFTIPFELLRFNSTLFTCLIRLMFQGSPLAGRPAFTNSVTSADNAEVRLSRFDHNHTFNVGLSRAQLLCAFIVVHSATTRITGALKSEINDYRTMRVLFLSSLQTCIDRLKPLLAQNKFPWIVAEEMAMIEQLRDHCTTDPKFTPKELCTLYSKRTTVLSHQSAPV